ncbi:hypothetical protein [Zobellia laminariae]|uniref:hypothetical protein n=1 Tax=Zobellia laminariae TaxID=248906 RepID=UPI0016A3AFB2|nr:hypothetical protein [Zobellia laminariae]MUH42136.1 hypothetical protein [Zobellia laminariae]WKX77689.1 hypothetical protein Q5W13_06685 [Zobellia laminariae]
MSKKKKSSKKKDKKGAKSELLQRKVENALADNAKLKSKCCKKYKKNESKRCGRCPCFDLLKKVA